MSDHHLITTPAIARACARCRRIILVGHAEGIHARVDPAPLNPAGEIAALLGRRRTYSLTRAGLVERDAGRVTTPRLAAMVLAEHRCGPPIPAAHLAPAIPPPHQPADDKEFPF